MHRVVSTSAVAALYPHVAARLSPGEVFKTVAVLGSGPAAPDVMQHLAPETVLVAVNNAWRAVPRYDALIYSDDLPEASKPPRCELGTRGRSSPQYWPAMQASGGLLYCGATMAFAAGYWVIHNLPSSQVSFFASDMTYGAGPTHFYGAGRPDPLRVDLSLQDLVAKGLRLFYFGLTRNCLLLNASAAPETRLPFPRVKSGRSLRKNVMAGLVESLEEDLAAMGPVAAEALELEASGPFDARVPDYYRWSESEVAWAHAAKVDAAWRKLAPFVERVGARVELAFADGPVAEAGRPGANDDVASTPSSSADCAPACGAVAELKRRTAEELELVKAQKVEVEARASAFEDALRGAEHELESARRLVEDQARRVDELVAWRDRLQRDYDVLERSAGMRAVRLLKGLPGLYPAFLAAKRHLGRT